MNATKIQPLRKATRHTIVLLLALFSATIVITGPWSPPHAKAASPELERLTLEGTWIGNLDASGNIDPNVVRMTAIPLDPTNQRVSLQLQNSGEDPNFGGIAEALLGAPATSRTDFWGEAVRTGPRSFNFSIVAHAINQGVMTGTSFQPVYTEVVSGTIVFIDRTTIRRTATAAFFAPDQNPLEDTPIVCSPFESTLRRLAVTPPCAF